MLSSSIYRGGRGREKNGWEGRAGSGTGGVWEGGRDQGSVCVCVCVCVCGPGGVGGGTGGVWGAGLGEYGGRDRGREEGGREEGKEAEGEDGCVIHDHGFLIKHITTSFKLFFCISPV